MVGAAALCNCPKTHLVGVEVAQIIATQEEMLKKEGELEEARKKLAQIC